MRSVTPWLMTHYLSHSRETETSVDRFLIIEEQKNQTNTNTEDTEYRPEEGLSPTAWRNLKIILVVGGIVGNLIMRFGLVDIRLLANRQC
jgi:hypothetical protein